MSLDLLFDEWVREFRLGRSMRCPAACEEWKTIIATPRFRPAGLFCGNSAPQGSLVNDRRHTQPGFGQLRDLFLAFECVCSCAPGESEAYICVSTGRIYLVSGIADSGEDVPEDIETSDQYIHVPHRSDLELGPEVVFAFVRKDMPDEWENIVDVFHRKGAYGEFRQMLRSRGLLDQWYAFEASAVENALREWSEENRIEFTDEEKSRTKTKRSNSAKV
jgi:hypothetical protein